MTTSREPIHVRLREYIDASEVSRKMICQKANLTEPHLSLLLNGKRRMTVDTFDRICDAMTCSDSLHTTEPGAKSSGFFTAIFTANVTVNGAVMLDWL